MPTPTKGYFLADGTRVPGTTTIIQRFKDSGALMQWAFKQGQSGSPSLYAEAEKAADIGTVAHLMVEEHLRGKAEDICRDLPALHLESPASQTKAQSAFSAYLAWTENFHVTLEATEVQLVSEKYKYGGTPDAIGFVGRNKSAPRERVLLDWKTSNGVYVDYLIQLAAYKHLWEENYPEKPIFGFHLLRFSKQHGDFAHHYFPRLDEAWEQFALFRKAYDLDKQLKQRV